VSWRALRLDELEAVPGPAGLAYEPVRLAAGDVAGARALLAEE
jgi:hypothetical protein